MDIEIVEFDDPEKNKLAETRYYEFLDWLNAQRRKAETAVRDLYPRLRDGVSAQEIQAVTHEAAWWRSIPDDLVGLYAYQSVANHEEHRRHQICAELCEVTVFEFWLDLNYDNDTQDTGLTGS